MKLGISYYSSAPKWQFAALVSDACTNPDKRAVCGDRTVDAGMGETCDDGNTVSGDGCSSTCQSEAPPPTGGGGAVTASPSVHVSVVGPDQQTATVSKVGDQATITLTVTNPTGASVPIKYTMPSGFKFDNVISGGTCTASGSDVTCTAVQPGTSMIKIKAEVTSL